MCIELKNQSDVGMPYQYQKKPSTAQLVRYELALDHLLTKQFIRQLLSCQD